MGLTLQNCYTPFFVPLMQKNLGKLHFAQVASTSQAVEFRLTAIARSQSLAEMSLFLLRCH
jgi:hypothetical protein